MNDVVMMTPAEIAEMLKVDRRNTAKLMKSPGFPAPAIDISQKNRRWTRASICKWVVDQQKKNSA